MKTLMYARLLLGLAVAVGASAGCLVTPGAGVGAGADAPSTDSGNDAIPADNIRNAVGTCGGNARDPGSHPNQLVPGNGLHRYTLQTVDAVCNDGSPAVVYIRAATDAAHTDDWVMHLQGGGSCTTAEECVERWCGSAFYDSSKMSSAWTPMTVGARGIHNADAALNDFAGWNHVFFYYCSSDSWQGRSTASLTSEDGDSSFTVFRHGHTIIERAFAELSDGVTSDSGEQVLPSLRDAGRVVWSGTSAGSVGARHNADWVRDWFGADTEVAAVFDAAVTPSGDFVDTETAGALDDAFAVRWALRLAQEEERPFLDESCVEAVGEDELRQCNVGAYLLGNHITTPFFVRMDLRDSNALGKYRALGMTPAEFVASMHRLLTALEDVQATGLEGGAMSRKPGLYGPNCGQHVGMEVNSWFFTASIDQPDGGSATFHDALTQWLGGNDFVLIDDVDGSLSNCETIDEDR